MCIDRNEYLDFVSVKIIVLFLSFSLIDIRYLG